MADEAATRHPVRHAPADEAATRHPARHKPLEAAAFAAAQRPI